MKAFLIFCLFTLISFTSFASNWFELKNNQLIRLETAPETKTEIRSREVLPLRIVIKKFIVTKTPEGISVRYEPVCEFPAKTDVADLSDGGLIQEQVYGSCESTKDGINVNVVTSGMVYDSVGSSFEDEERAKRRNFFSHFYLESSEMIFGLGDFNLGTTRDLPFKHWMSELSTDSAGGSTLKTSKREGFITSIRYGKG